MDIACSSYALNAPALLCLHQPHALGATGSNVPRLPSPGRLSSPVRRSAECNDGRNSSTAHPAYGSCFFSLAPRRSSPSSLTRRRLSFPSEAVVATAGRLFARRNSPLCLRGAARSGAAGVPTLANARRRLGESLHNHPSSPTSIAGTCSPSFPPSNQQSAASRQLYCWPSSRLSSSPPRDHHSAHLRPWQYPTWSLLDPVPESPRDRRDPRLNGLHPEAVPRPVDDRRSSPSPPRHPSSRRGFQSSD